MELMVGTIPVSVTKKKIKSMHLYVKPPLGEVVVTAPRYISDREIESFVRSREDWIKTNVNRFQNTPETLNPSYETGEKIAVFGEIYGLLVLEGTRYSMELHDGQAVLTVRTGSTKDQREHFVNEWYREQLTERVNILLPKWEEYTGLKCSSWQSKNMKSRWGTCNTSTKKIWLNLQLAKRPEECLDYVILHELTHTLVPDHGVKFKAVMNQFMPNWKEIRNRLNGRG